MGVKHLWATLDEIKQSQSLLVSATERRLTPDNGLFYMIGVDMGTLMAECNAGARAAGVHNQQAGGGLYIFFKKLAYFLEIPAAFVFVLDGPARPRIKRGHEVRHRPIWWTNLAIDLIEHFGYIVRRAPAEAEAELARLNACGIIHAVMTSDSDAIVFGAEYTLRSIPQADRQFDDEYLLYDTRAPGASSGGSDGFPLTQGNLVLFALFCGGDYDDGIAGCGAATAKGLIRCGFGEQLLNAFRNLDGREYEEFLTQWRAEIRLELSTNSRGFLPISRPHLAAALSNNFPNQRVVRLYLDPITTSSPGYESNQTWGFSQPAIAHITEFCMRHFNWDREEVTKKFSAYLWRGIFLQEVYSTLVVYTDGPGTCYGRLQMPYYPGAKILKLVHKIRQGQYARMFGNHAMPRLLVSVSEFIDAMGPAFSGVHSTPISVWLPAPLRSLVRTSNPYPFPDAIFRGPGPAPFTSSPAPSLSLSTSGANQAYIGPQDPRWVRTPDGRWFIDLSEDNLSD